MLTYYKVQYFIVYSLVVFSIIKRLCCKHHYLHSEYFHHRKNKPHPQKQPFPISLPIPWQALIYFYILWIFIVSKFHINGTYNLYPFVTCSFNLACLWSSLTLWHVAEFILICNILWCRYKYFIYLFIHWWAFGYKLFEYFE